MTAVVGTLLVATPLVLATRYGSPLPTSIPSLDAVVSTPLQLVDPDVVLGILVCAAWLTWLLFAAFTCGHALAVARGALPTVSGGHGMGAVAGRFVASVVLLTSLARSAPLAAMPSPTVPLLALLDQSPSADVIDAVGATDPRPDATEPRSEPASADSTYTVVRGDSLWRIAEQHLGSGFRWTEIYDLNRHLIIDPDLICTGWQLTMPAAGSEANQTSQPSQHAFNDHDEFASNPARAVHALVAREGTAAPARHVSPTTAPSVVDPVVPTGVTTLEVPAPPSIRPRSAGVLDEGDDVMLPGRAPTIAGITGATVLATGLLAHRRTRRRRPTTNESCSDVDHALVAAADLPLVRWVGQELALLGEQLAGRNIDAVPVAVEFSEDTGIELLWDRPLPGAPAPWEDVPGAWAWRTLYDPECPVSEPELPALIPGLVTFGRRDGKQLLVNLEALGAVSITGDDDAVESFVRSIVTEIGCSDELADGYALVPEELASSVNTSLSRILVVDPDEAVDRIEAAGRAIAEQLEPRNQAALFTHRLAEVPVLHAEVIVAVANGKPADYVAALLDALHPNRGVAGLIVGEAAHAPATMRIDGERARLEPLGLTFEPVALAATTQEALGAGPTPPHPLEEPRGSIVAAPVAVESLTVGPGDDLGHDEDPWTAQLPYLIRNRPSHERVAELIRLTEHIVPEPRLLVKVLGPPRLVNGPDLGRRQLELVVYLACAGRPVNYEHIQDALWGGAPVSRKTIFNLIGQTRTALGQWDGIPILGPATRPHGLIELHADVRTDLAVVNDLTAAAASAPSDLAALLHERAESYVEGPPFDAPGYDWASNCC
jgi:hypothetical protein